MTVYSASLKDTGLREASVPRSIGDYYLAEHDSSMIIYKVGYLPRRYTGIADAGLNEEYRLEYRDGVYKLSRATYTGRSARLVEWEYVQTAGTPEGAVKMLRETVREVQQEVGV